MNHRQPELTDSFLADLKDDLVCRRVGRGMKRLEEHQHLLSSFDPKQKNAAVVTGYLAQWVDVGYQRPRLVKEILLRFTHDVRAQLPLRDYVHLRTAEGMVAMSQQATGEAIQNFDFVRSLAQEIGDRELLSVVNFWKGRCLRMRGEYDQALTCTVEARDLALAAGHEPMAAVMRVLESWLYFQKENSKEAERILREAEAILRKTDDHVTLGNIHSSYGRIALRHGRYQHAIDHFVTAITEYKKTDPQHRNVARSLNNLAYSKRLIALQLRRKIDADVARRRKPAKSGSSKGQNARVQYRSRFEQLRQEAFAALSEAEEIYRHHPNHHGIGNMHLNYGNLYLDNGDVERAEAEAATAFELGEQKKDNILMGRARLLQCMVENARVEEEIGDGTEGSTHARLAQDCAHDAVELSKHTQDRRLLAHAHIWEGLTCSNNFFENMEAARRCYELAASLSKGDYPDSAWEDMQTLKARIFRKGTVDPKLRAWSQGSVGDKTFQQITEEFAELIIPKVWEREDRKISRVASRLSVSPKKVRRILTRVGRRKPSGQ
jgi:tetratricopeptide (TPR) repeat protein